MEQPLKVKKVGDSYDLRLVPAFVKANRLQDGDFIILDMSKIRIIRAEDWALVGRNPVIQPAA